MIAVLESYQNCNRNVLEVCQNLIGLVLELNWNFVDELQPDCNRIVLKLFQNCISISQFHYTPITILLQVHRDSSIVLGLFSD